MIFLSAGTQQMLFISHSTVLIWYSDSEKASCHALSSEPIPLTFAPLSPLLPRSYESSDGKHFSIPSIHSPDQSSCRNWIGFPTLSLNTPLPPLPSLEMSQSLDAIKIGAIPLPLDSPLPVVPLAMLSSSFSRHDEGRKEVPEIDCWNCRAVGV